MTTEQNSSQQTTLPSPSRAGFLNLGTIGILDQTVLWRRLYCALWEDQQHPWPSPTKNLQHHCPSGYNQNVSKECEYPLGAKSAQMKMYLEESISFIRLWTLQFSPGLELPSLSPSRVPLLMLGHCLPDGLRTTTLGFGSLLQQLWLKTNQPASAVLGADGRTKQGFSFSSSQQVGARVTFLSQGPMFSGSQRSGAQALWEEWSSYHSVVSARQAPLWAQTVLNTCPAFMHTCSVTQPCQLSATPWTVALQAPLSMGFPR